MEEKIFGSLEVDECVQLRILVDSNMREMGEKGFSYLNSRKNYEFFQEYNRLKETILKALDDDRLVAIHKMEKETIDSREEEMLKNIYAYCRDHSFTTGLMFIGSGHMITLPEKVERHEEDKEKVLNWIFHNTD